MVLDTKSHQKYEFYIPPGEIFRMLRVIISSKLKIEMSSYKLIYMGTPLKDEQAFASYKINKDATINIVK